MLGYRVLLDGLSLGEHHVSCILCLMLADYWLEKTPESPFTARRSNQSILKEVSLEYSMERLMLKLQYFDT